MSERVDWLEWRRAGIGGSDVAALMGLSPWSSPWSLWANKVGLLPDQDASEAMEFGSRIEPVMAGYFHDRTGLHVAGEQTWCSHPSEPWMRCTVDGFVFECDPYIVERPNVPSIGDALGVAEWKSTSDGPWDEVPAHYACQAQWSLAVTGLPTVWFGVLHLAFGRPQFRVYEMHRDEDDIALLTKTARTFWFDHVLTGMPPATDGSQATTDALAAAWEPVDGETVEADDDLATSVIKLARYRAEVKALEPLIAAEENAVRAALAEATVLTRGVDEKGKPKVLATWKPQERTTIDAALLRLELPEVAAQYSKTTESRVLRLSNTKGK